VAPAEKAPSKQVKKAAAVPSSVVKKKVEKKVVAAKPVPAVEKAKVLKGTSNGVDLLFVKFDSDVYDLRVVDQEGGPGSQWATAALLGRSSGAAAVINGGFFTPEGDPLGLVISGGQRRGFWNKISSLCSGVYVSGSEGPRLVRQESWLPQREASDLLQTGPFLVDKTKVVAGLEDEEERARSFLLWDGGDGWALGYAQSATLAELAIAIKKETVSGLRAYRALNLDGGRSTDLWVSSSVVDGPVTKREWYNRPVRNFLVLKEKVEPAPLPKEVEISAKEE